MLFVTLTKVETVWITSPLKKEITIKIYIFFILFLFLRVVADDGRELDHTQWQRVGEEGVLAAWLGQERRRADRRLDNVVVLETAALGIGPAADEEGEHVLELHALERSNGEGAAGGELVDRDEDLAESGSGRGHGRDGEDKRVRGPRRENTRVKDEVVGVGLARDNRHKVGEVGAGSSDRHDRAGPGVRHRRGRVARRELVRAGQLRVLLRGHDARGAHSLDADRDDGGHDALGKVHDRSIGRQAVEGGGHVDGEGERLVDGEGAAGDREDTRVGPRAQI